MYCAPSRPKSEQKHITKNFVEFHNHSPLLTMIISIEEINGFIEQGSRYHPAIKFTAELSGNESIFPDTYVYKGDKFKEKAILDLRTHYKPKETFSYTHFSSCHPPGVSKGFIKGEALRLLRAKTPKKKTFHDIIRQFKPHLYVRSYPDTLMNKVLSEVKFRHSNQKKKRTWKFYL